MSKRFNRDDVDKFHDYNLYIPTRTIYVGSEDHSMSEGESGTDGQMAETIIKNLTILEGLSSEEITIVMNNIGGDTYHGCAIYDAIKACKSHVVIKVFGHAMSMGSVILQAADQRIMAPSAKQMIHYGTWGVSDHSKTAIKQAKEFEKMDEWLEDVYLRRIQEKLPGFTLGKLEKLLDHDTYLTAQESVDLGLADSILEIPVTTT